MEGQLILFPQLIFKIIKPKIIALLILNSYSPIQLKMQALKNLFTKKQPEETKSTESTFDHSKLTSSDDIAQCPFMKNKQQKQATQPKDLPKQDQGKCPYKGDKSTKPKPTQQGQSSQSEDQAPRGGCPFMGGSQRKRNPDLFQTPPLAYDQPFVSKFHYYLSSSKIDLTMLSAHNRKKSLPISRSREIFNTYPIYLQHSLFFNGEDYKKVRGIQCCSRFLPYDKLREKGNKLFNKGMYSQALQYYQRALSLFKWLQHYEQQPDDKKSQLNDSISHPSMSSLPSTQSLHNSSSSNVHINLTSQQQQKQQLFEKDEQLEEMKTKYKEFFVVYSDGNVRLFDGEEMEDQPDVDMRKSLMLQVLLNMSVAYSHLGHFSVALQCIDDCLHLSDKVSQVYLRKAQILIFNRGCSLQQALQAKHCIQKALHLKSTQKIFQSGQHVLKMINLHNAQQSYQKTLDLVNERVKAIQDEVNKLTEKIYNRAREIHLVEQRLIQEGRTPYQRHEEGIQRSKEFKILLRMKQKYIKVIEFYTEAQNKQQVHLAKKQLQQLLRVFAEMNTIINLTINQTDQQLGGIHSQKIQRRIETIKKNHCEDIYNGGRFNFTVMEWAIKEIVKEERQEEEFKKREEEQGKRENGECVGGKVEKSGLVKMASWGLVLIPIVGILVNQFLLV